MSKRVLNKCWGNSIEKLFCPVFHGGSSLRNVFKKIKKFSKFQKRPKSFPKCPNVSWTSVGVILSKNYFAQCCMEGRVFEMFLKKYKKFQNSKNAQNRTQTFQKCFEHVLGYFLGKILFAQCSMEGRVFEMFSENQKKFKIPKTTKIAPRLSKSALNMFWVNIFDKIFLPSVPWRVESSKCSQKIKNFQNCKKAQSRSQKCPNVFWTCFGVIFSNFFCPVFHVGSSLRNDLKKSRNIQNSKNAQNRSQKCPNLFWTIFEVIFSRNFFAQCSREGRVFEMFSKNLETFKIPKTPKIVPKSVQKCFEHVLGYIFWKNFSAQCSMEGWDFEMFSENQKILQNSKNAQNPSQNVQTCFEQVLG